MTSAVVRSHLIDFGQGSRGLDESCKLKLILFAAGLKPATFIQLKINENTLEEEHIFRQLLKEEGVVHLVGRPKSYEEISSIKGSVVRWSLRGLWIGFDLFRSRKEKRTFLRYTSLLERGRRAAGHRIAGAIYGYPRCCVEAYLRESAAAIARRYSCYAYYKTLHALDRAFPWIQHRPHSLNCAATKALNRRYALTVRRLAPLFWNSYTRPRTARARLIVDKESDVLVRGRSIWPRKDGHEYSVITAKPVFGHRTMLPLLTRRDFERGTIINADLRFRYDYVDIKIRSVDGVLRGLRHIRKHWLISRPY